MSSSYNAQYDDDAAAYDELRAGWMRQRRIETFARFLDAAAPGDRVCEIGSGTGAILLELARERPDLTFVGVEPVAGYVEFASARADELGVPNASFHTGTAEGLGALGVGPVAWWYSSDVLHHLADERSAIRAVTGSSSAGASWMIIEPNRLNAYVGAYQARTAGERNFRPRHFAGELGAAGWQIDERGHIFLVPASVQRLSPAMQRVERALERIPVVGGGVTMRCRLTR